jgi:hypothetical protein
MGKHDWVSSTYYFVDLTCGSGIADDQGTLGSPLIFERVCRNRDSLCVAVDRVGKHIKRLKKRLSSRGVPEDCFEFVVGDYRKDALLIRYMIRSHARRIPMANGKYRKPLGLVYCDPSGSLVDFNAIGDVVRGSPMDVLVALSATNIKRVVGALDDRNEHLEDGIVAIPKNCWLVREPYRQHQWTMLLGSKSDLMLSKFSKQGFVNLFSPMGARIFERLNFSKPEGAGLESRREDFLRRTNGVCAFCGNTDYREDGAVLTRWIQSLLYVV